MTCTRAEGIQGIQVFQLESSACTGNIAGAHWPRVHTDAAAGPAMGSLVQRFGKTSHSWVDFPLHRVIQSHTVRAAQVKPFSSFGTPFLWPSSSPWWWWFMCSQHHGKVQSGRDLEVFSSNLLLKKGPWSRGCFPAKLCWVFLGKKFPALVWEACVMFNCCSSGVGVVLPAGGRNSP